MLIDDIPHQPVVRRRLDAEATTMSDSLQPDDQVPQLLHFDHKDTVFYGKHQGKSEKDTKKEAPTHDCESGLSLKKDGGFLLSRIALQYHRRRRA